MLAKVRENRKNGVRSSAEYFGKEGAAQKPARERLDQDQRLTMERESTYRATQYRTVSGSDRMLALNER